MVLSVGPLRAGRWSGMITEVDCKIVKLFHCFKTNNGLHVERFCKSLIDF